MPSQASSMPSGDLNRTALKYPRGVRSQSTTNAHPTTSARVAAHQRTISRRSASHVANTRPRGCGRAEARSDTGGLAPRDQAECTLHPCDGRRTRAGLEATRASGRAPEYELDGPERPPSDDELNYSLPRGEANRHVLCAVCSKRVGVDREVAGELGDEVHAEKERAARQHEASAV